MNSSRMVMGIAALVAALGLGACGGGGGGDEGNAPIVPSASPLTGQFVGDGVTVTIDADDQIIGHVSRTSAQGVDTVTFSGLVVEQGDGRWGIPNALISTTITPNGAPTAQFTTRANMSGTFVSRGSLSVALPPAAVPPGMSANQSAAYVNMPVANVPDAFGPYFWQAGSPPVTVRTFDVLATSNIAGTYVANCNVTGPIRVLDAFSAVYTADLLFTGPSCPDASGHTRRLLGTWMPGSPTILRLFFVDNAGNLHRFEGQRGAVAN